MAWRQSSSHPGTDWGLSGPHRPVSLIGCLRLLAACLKHCGSALLLVPSSVLRTLPSCATNTWAHGSAILGGQQAEGGFPRIAGDLGQPSPTPPGLSLQVHSTGPTKGKALKVLVIGRFQPPRVRDGLGRPLITHAVEAEQQSAASVER